jgi:hypothetical protein
MPPQENLDSPKGPSDPSPEVTLNEIAFVWPENVRNERYKNLIEQYPHNLDELAIAKGILNPQEERVRVLAENRTADRDDNLRNYRR